MDRRRNDLNALRQAREHLLEIERLGERSAELKQEMQMAKADCNRTYEEVKQKRYPTNREKELLALFVGAWKEKQNTKREKREKMRKNLMIILSVGIFIVFAVFNAKAKDEQEKALMIGVLLGCYVVLFIIRSIMKWMTDQADPSAFRLTENEKKQLAEYAAQDARNAEAFNQYVQQMNQEAEQRAKEITRHNTALIAELERKTFESYVALQQLDILGKNEENLDAVNALIDIMESHRADSLPEALRVYDAQQHRHNQIVQAQFNERMRLLDQKWQQQEQFDRDMAEAAHRRRMEELEQKQLDALEQERRDNEYYRRYGKS